MSEQQRKLPIFGAKAPDGIGGPDYVRLIQERIEEGKRNAPEILRQIALFQALQERVNNAEQEQGASKVLRRDG
jgi:hypothetical protein